MAGSSTTSQHGLVLACLLFSAVVCVADTSAGLDLGSIAAAAAAGSTGLSSQLTEPELPSFLQSVFSDLLSSAQSLKPSTDSAGSATPPGSSLLTRAELLRQAQAWAESQQQSLATKRPMTSGWANYTKTITLPLLGVLDNLLNVKPILERTYFNYWNATYQRYAGYAQQLRVSLGYAPTGPLTDQLVADFRRVTGTTCSPARFTPPQDTNTTISGTGITFTVNLGNCQLTRAAIQTRRDWVTRCTLPRTSVAITNPRYSGRYVAPAAFASTVCRRQYTYGTDSTTRITLFNPGQLFNPDSTANRLLPLSDADEDGIPNFLDKTGKLKLLSEVLRSWRLDATKALTQGQKDIDRIRDFLIDKLKSKGLNVTVSKEGGLLDSEREGKQRARQGVRKDLSELFPNLVKWELGTGVPRIYDAVLQQGLMSTLYRKGGQPSLFGFNRGPMGQSAGDLGSEDPASNSDSGGAGSDIFQRLADEMDRLLEARAVAEELRQQPPTGRKVVKRVPATSAPTGGTGAPGEQGEEEEDDVSAAALASAVKEVVHGLGSVFAKAGGAQPEQGDAVLMLDDGGVEVAP